MYINEASSKTSKMTVVDIADASTTDFKNEVSDMTGMKTGKLRNDGVYS